MLWFGKKKKKDIENEIENEPVIDADGEDSATEEEIIDILNEDGSPEAAETVEAEETEQTDDSPKDVIRVIKSIDELADYVSSKTIGTMQFMRKENNEAFDLREVYIRVAEVWGSVSMAREYTPAEYARIMLAIELLESPDDFYVLPTVSDEEREKAIIDFCDEKYGGGGKKYARNLDRFARLVRDNGDMDEWLAHSRWLITEKVTEFCEKNGIEFGSESETVTEESDE